MKHSVKKVLENKRCGAWRWIRGRKSKWRLANWSEVAPLDMEILVVDMRNLVMMREFAPVIFDATHSVQMPSALGEKSGGDARFVPYLARAAASVGVVWIFLRDAHKSLRSAYVTGQIC